NVISCPVTGPSPLVLKFGFGKIPLRTEFAAVNDGLISPGVNVSSPAVEFLPVNSVSDGELTRVGTFPLGGLTESTGNTWYRSMLTSVMFVRGTPPVISPVNVALVMSVVGAVVTKSSADSIWELGARAAVAIRPS